jgi:hypothetical protein
MGHHSPTLIFPILLISPTPLTFPIRLTFPTYR